MSNDLNNLFNNNVEEDSDDDFDCDYKPENDVLSADSDSGSDSQSEHILRKTFSKRNPKSETNGRLTSDELEEEIKIENKATEEEEKAKADSLWAEFCKDIPLASKPKPNTTQTVNNTNSFTSNTSCAQNNEKSVDNNSISDNNNKVLISKTFDFAGESVTVVEEVADASGAKQDTKPQTNGDSKNQTITGVKRSAGLGGILEQLKKPKINTLQKSLIDWNNFKKEEGIEDQLSQHKKSKDTFVERQAFLQRTDLRQFEIEKEVRAKNRAQRQLSKN